MNKKIYLLPLLLLAALFTTSCEETKEASKYDNWQARNEAFTDSLRQVFEAKSDPELLAFTPMINQRVTVYYKKKKSNDIGEIPLYTSDVSLFYRGTLFTGEMFDQNFTGTNPGPFDRPNTWSVEGFLTSVDPAVSGFAEVLQLMRVGERWLVYFPWQLCYGENGTEGILGYSSLIFDIQLEEIVTE